MEEVIIYGTTRSYTKNAKYVKDKSVYRDGHKITSFNTIKEAETHAYNLNKQFGDLEAYELLNGIRNEITLYEDGEFSAETIVESIKAIIDSRERL